MDDRILHVPSTYGDYANLSVSAQFEKISKELTQKFKHIAEVGTSPYGSGSRAAAQKLQDFFQKLKAMSDDTFSQQDIQTNQQLSVIRDILSVARDNNKASFKNRKITKFFHHTSADNNEQGEVFEKEIAAILSATKALAEGNNLKKPQILANATSMWLGKTRTNIAGAATKDEVKALVNNAAQMVIQDANSQAKALFQKRKKNSSLDSLATTKVSNKIDVSGLTSEWTISTTAAPYLKEIAQLLSQASFTAKSYASSHWRETGIDEVTGKAIGEYVLTEYKTLHLGKTNPGRIFTDLFLTQVPMPVAISMYMYLLNTSNAVVQKEAAQLRMLYELTGYGQTIVDKVIREQLNRDGLAFANYIIYNDPVTEDIFVQSTADLWLRMRKNVVQQINKALVQVPKEWFKI